jgi:hypothetical protein
MGGRWVEFVRHGGKFFLCLIIGAYCECPSDVLLFTCNQSRSLILWPIKRRSNWIGYGVGLVMRIPFRQDPHNKAVYIVQYLFLVLSVSFVVTRSIRVYQNASTNPVHVLPLRARPRQPCAFLAADYILLGRIVSHLNGDSHLKPVKPSKVTLFFVLSDVATFLIQAAGGGLSISDNRKTSDAGQKIFLAGICLQLASFAFFTGLWALFGWRV